jgi:methylmalonyl-CoA/ethylmalonyl-CoA epimerase
MAADRIELDHLAVAMEDHADGMPRYAGQLGGTFAGHGAGIGFSPLQVEYANGMRVEMLRPNMTEHNDFLRRFLDRSGPGPHHLTFKVPSLDDAIDASEAAGYPVINIDRSYPEWLEGFVHPKMAHGIVVQMAQTSADGDEWRRRPSWFPEPAASPASLDHVEHWVASLDGALELFESVLAGERVDEGDGWVELGWGAGHIRLVKPSGAGDEAWLAGGPGRVHHAAFSVDDPRAIPGANALADGRYEVAPEDNLGLRLILLPR